MKKSIFHFEKSLHINPNFFKSYTNLSTIFIQNGQLNSAIKILEKAFNICPINIEVNRQLWGLKYFDLNLNHIKKLKDLFNKTNISNSDKIKLGFTLGKIYADVKDYNQSFNFYKKANQLTKNKINYNIRNDRELFDKIKSTFIELKLNINPNLQGKQLPLIQF